MSSLFERNRAFLGLYYQGVDRERLVFDEKNFCLIPREYFEVARGDRAYEIYDIHPCPPMSHGVSWRDGWKVHEWGPGHKRGLVPSGNFLLPEGGKLPPRALFGFPPLMRAVNLHESLLGPIPKKRALFLDRDGVLIEDTGYPHKKEDLSIKKEIIPILRKFQKEGYLLVILSNQSGVEKGKFSQAQAQNFHNLMVEEFRKDYDIEFDGVYYCYHRSLSVDRKPGVGMLCQAIEEHGINPFGSLMIGDKPSDHLDFPLLKFCRFGQQLLLLAVLLVAPWAWGLDLAQGLGRYLEAVAGSSREISSSAHTLRATLAGLEQELVPFEWQGEANTSSLRDTRAPRNPFSSTERSSSGLEGKVSKKWRAGFESTLTHGLYDESMEFAQRPHSQYQSFELSLAVSTSPWQEFWNKKNRIFFDRIEEDRDLAHLEALRAKKAVLRESVLDLAHILKIKDEIFFQQSLCQQLKEQSQKLRAKRLRSSISQRQYLTTQKERVSCLGLLKALEQNLQDKVQGLWARYGLGTESSLLVEGLKVGPVFHQVERAYQKLSLSKQDIKEDLDFRWMEKRIQVAGLRSSELAAQVSPGPMIVLTSGLNGRSYEQLFEGKHSFVSAKMVWRFPFENRSLQLAMSQAEYARISLLDSYALIRAKKKAKWNSLKGGIEKDFAIYKDYQQSVEFSKKILKEAQRDFANGKMDFFLLVEFQKGVILDQKRLSAHKAQMVVKMVEYMDFFGFFESYLET